MRDDEGDQPRTAPNGVSLGPLPGSIGYALRRAQLAVFEDFIRSLEALDLRPAVFSTLLVIGENPGLNQSEVSAALGIQRTNFVAVVARLEKRGLIVRRPAKSDRRSYALHLTQEGRVLLDRALQLQGAHEERLAGKLGPGGREELLALLWKLAE